MSQTLRGYESRYALGALQVAAGAETASRRRPVPCTELLLSRRPPNVFDRRTRSYLQGQQKTKYATMIGGVRETRFARETDFTQNADNNNCCIHHGAQAAQNPKYHEATFTGDQDFRTTRAAVPGTPRYTPTAHDLIITLGCSRVRLRVRETPQDGRLQ